MQHSLRLAAAAMILATSATAQDTLELGPQRLPASASGVIVRLKQAADADREPAELLRHRIRLARVYDRLPRLRKLEFAQNEKPVTADQLLAKIKILKDTGLYAYVEPDWQVTLLQAPTDAAFTNGTLWGLRNTGQNGGTAGIDVNAVNAWTLTTGSPDVVVGVVDTGIRLTHNDLSGNLWRNPNEIAGNGIDDDGNGYIDDVHGINAIANNGNPNDDNNHGTHVAGTIAARANDGNQLVGVAYNTRLMALKFLNAEGSGSTSDAIECINYAVAEGVDILNNSWGGGGYSQALFDAIRAADEAGVLFVAAAGNEASNSDAVPAYPAAYDLRNVISVAAIDRQGNLASFSNFGAASVDLGAPGVSIFSTTATSNTSYASFDGTSMACPHVAGVAALLRARFPGASVPELRARLLNTTVPLPALTGRCVTGGRVDAFRALNATADGNLELAATTLGSLSSGTSRPFFVSVSDLTPVTGATVTGAFGSGSATAFLDNGVAPDATANDGIYSRNLIIPPGSSATLNIQASAPGKNPATAAIPFEISSPPPNDAFANRIPLDPNATGTTGTNRFATTETSEPRQPSGAGTATVWWAWTPSSSQSATISTSGSDFDTTLAVYTGSGLANLSLVAANDDFSGLQSSVTFDAVAGTSYFIQVSGYAEAQGTITLNHPPAGNPGAPVIVSQPAPRSVLVGQPFSLSVTATGANPLAYQWRRNGEAIPGATASTYSVTSATAAQQGTYSVRVSNTFGALTSSDAFVAIQAVEIIPENDRFADATTLSGPVGRIGGTTLGSSGEEGEPNHASASNPLHSIWYRWTAPASGRLDLDTFGSDFDTTLAVYTGSAVSSLTTVAANDDAASTQSAVSLAVTSGVTYHIAVDGYGSSQGSVALNYAFSLAQPPPNDHFANRIRIYGSRNVIGSNSLATGEASEPDHADTLGTRNSVWWTWTPRASGTVFISTQSSNFDTTLSVYTGTDVGNLTLVAQNDDFNNTTQSAVQFTVEAGTPYQIAVDGYQGQTGDIALFVGLDPAPEVPEILLLDDQRGGFGDAARILDLAGYVVTEFTDEFAFGYEFVTSPSFLNFYDVVIYAERGDGEGAALPTAAGEALGAFAQGGRHLLITGFDSLHDPEDPTMAALVGATATTNTATDDPRWVISNTSHPILNGPFGDFRGLSFDAGGYDDDGLSAAAGAIELIATGSPRRTAKLLLTAFPSSGGSVAFWNGGLPGTATNAQPDFSDGGAPQAVFLNYIAWATGITPPRNPEIAVEVNDLDQPDAGPALSFGAVAHFDSAARFVTVRNVGTDLLGGLQLNIRGPDATSFTATPLPPVLAPGENATTTVIASPQDGIVGTRVATLELFSNDGDESPFHLPLTFTSGTPLALFEDAAARAGLPEGQLDPDAQPFNDGVPSLLRYAFNLPLNAPGAPRLIPGGAAGLPILIIDPAGNGASTASSAGWTFEFVRRKGAGLIYQPLISDTLEAGSFVPMTGNETVTPIDQTWERVRIQAARDFRTQRRGFARIQVDLP